MTSIVLDGETIKDRAEALGAFAPHFPDYYGRNLDALLDCLTDFSEAVEIRVIRCRALQAKLGPFWNRLRMVLERAEEENPLISVVEEE